MKKIKQILFILAIIVSINSCISYKSSTTTSKGKNLKDYKYIVFGEDDKDGSDNLNDIMIKVENEITEYFEVVSSRKALELIDQDILVASPKIHIETQYWDGGHTYITITFVDFNDKSKIAVVKSSGIGMSISQDQKLATYAIRRQLKKALK